MHEPLTKEQREFYGETVDDLLKRWDAGDTIWSIEMGGLGPGYEQALQVAAVEMARDNKEFVPPEEEPARSDAWAARCTKTLKRLREAGCDLGLTGAQCGAASWLAYQWCHNGGPAAVIERHKNVDPDRPIQVSKNVPVVP